MNSLKTAALALAVAGTLSSCSFLRSDYERTTNVHIPEQFEQNVQYQSVIRDAESSWWRDFNDPLLSGLIEYALNNANQLKIALATLQRYALRADLTDLNLLPTPNASMSSGRNWDNRHDRISSNSSASVGISYELDLFGRLKAERDVDRMAYEASVWDFKAAKLTIAVNIAKLYWQLAYFHDALAFEQQNLKDYEKILEKIKIRYDAGAISRYDYNRTVEQSLSSKNNIITFTDNIQETMNQLMILLSVDSMPKELDVSQITLRDTSIPSINPGIPADILENRPDLQAAEYKLKSLLASYDVTRLNFFPKITLTGKESTSSDQLLEFFTNPVTAIAGSIALPFLNYSTLSLNRDIAKVDYEKAVLEYETKVRTALLEVKLLTGELDRSHEKLSNARKRVELAQQNDRSYDVKYNSGAMSYNDFLNNKLMLRSYILNLLKEVQTQLNYEAELYNALGGSQKTDNNQQADGL